MDANKDSYHISFFKPTNKRTKANRNMVLWLVSLWALAVFGFHFVLKIIEEPTPEKELSAYMEVKDKIFSGTADKADFEVYAKSNLQVLCKVFIPKEDRDQLQNTMNWALYKMADEESLEKLKSVTKNFEEIEENTTDITEEKYLLAKNKLKDYGIKVINIEPTDRRAAILPLEINSEYLTETDKENLQKTEELLTKYMTHYESALTRAKILGFPFHYFYSAVFLLILFVLICFIYAKRTDSQNKKYQIED